MNGREQTLTRVQAAMDRLSPQHRAALTLQLDDVPTAEIAEALRCSEATVRVHLHRALTTLRKTEMKPSDAGAPSRSRADRPPTARAGAGRPRALRDQHRGSRRMP